MLEGGGKTPILNPIELEEIGFKLIAYPLSLIGVSIRAMEVRTFNLHIWKDIILPSHPDNEMAWNIKYFIHGGWVFYY